MRSFSHNGLLNYSQRLRRLRLLAGVFLLVLLVPLGTLTYFGFNQIKQNMLAEYQREANSFLQSANRNLFKRRLLTNSFSPDAFNYHQQVYDPVRGETQHVPSLLSQLDFSQPKMTGQVRGLVGFFQFNQQGEFNSPIWPYALSQTPPETERIAGSSAELAIRKQKAQEIFHILNRSDKIQRMLQQQLEGQDILFSILFDVQDYFIFYRVVPLNDEKVLQGYLVERKAYLSHLFTDLLEQRHFNHSVLLRLYETSHDNVEYFLYQNAAYGQVQVSHPDAVDKGYQQQAILTTHLRWPFDLYEVSMTTSALPVTSEMLYSGIFILLLVAAILGACYGFYRLGVKQLALAEQRLNFVSSVSHELKTPLTSIRMYCEMLKSGTILSEQHKTEYYGFIFSESERLTRLINNVLQLSKLSHHQQVVEPEFVSLAFLQDTIRSKVSTLLEKHHFQLNIRTQEFKELTPKVFIDKDAFSQVIINVSDNAVKFFDREKITDPRRLKLDFTFRPHPDNKQLVQLEIRDYGEGISPEQENKIFELFYRGGNELTRTTQGTGIGLALVKELVCAQQGEIVAKRKDPGLAFILSFRAKY